jgi:hypothetical protein
MLRTLFIASAILAWQVTSLPLASTRCDMRLWDRSSSRSSDPSAPGEILSPTRSECCCGSGVDCSCCCKERSQSESTPETAFKICPCTSKAVPTVQQSRVTVERARELPCVGTAPQDQDSPVGPILTEAWARAHSPPHQLTHVRTFVLLI